MALLGNNLFIMIGSGAQAAIIAGTKTNEIQSGSDLIEISSSTNGQWREYLAGRKEWSFTTGFLLLQNTDVLKLLDIGTTYTISVASRTGSNTTTHLTGSAILKVCRIVATVGNLVQGSFQFVGTGALSIPVSS